MKTSRYKILNGRVIKDITIVQDSTGEVIVSIIVEGDPEESYSIMTNPPKPSIHIMHLKDSLDFTPIFEKDYVGL
jgi:hypothetical protein